MKVTIYSNGFGAIAADEEGNIIAAKGYRNVLCNDLDAMIDFDELEVVEEPDIMDEDWDEMSYDGLRYFSNMTQKQFANFFYIPVSTVQEWDQHRRFCPVYEVNMMVYLWKNYSLRKRYDEE